MRWSSPRSLMLALASLAMIAFLWTIPPQVHGQEKPSPAKPVPKDDPAKRLEGVDKTINQHLDEGQFAEAIPSAREKLELLERTRGKDHWETGVARRDVETYERLAAQPREIQEQFVKALQANKKGIEAFTRRNYTEAQALFREALEIHRRVLVEHPDTATCYHNLAATLQAQGKYAEAEAMHRQALAIRIKALGAEHPDTATCYNNLAATLEALRKYAEAEAMYRQALAIRIKALGEDHPVTAISCNNLAEFLRNQGKYAEAEAMHRQALAIHIKALGEDHPDTASCYHNLAATLREQGKHAEAESMFRRALAIRIKTQGEDHPDTATGYYSLALILEDQRKHTEAVAILHSALAIRIKALGEEHPVTAHTFDKLAVNLLKQGEYAEAESMFRRALAIRLKALGEDHPDTAAGYSALAMTLLKQRKFAEAEAMYRHVLAIRLKTLGEDHPDTADAYHDLAETFLEQGKYAEAEEMSRRALAIYLKARGEDHPDTAAGYSALAMTLLAEGKYAEAEAMCRRALAIRLKTLGKDPRNTGNGYNSLAITLLKQGKHAEAESMFRRALAILLKAQGEDHPGTVASYNNLAVTLQNQGKHAEAEAMHRRALAINLKALGEDHPDTATTIDSLAGTFLKQGKYAEAESMFRRALAIRIKTLGEDHPSTARSYNNLAVTFLEQGKYAEAESMFRRALAIRLKALGEDHPDTATTIDSLAMNLRYQGKHAEAEAMHRQALAILVKALGAEHPYAATNYSHLARTLDLQGKHDKALQTWISATASYEQARLRSVRGLEAALTPHLSPLPSLALILAHAGQPRDAWIRWEQGLARGVLDETVGRATRPLTAEDRKQEADLLGQSQALDERIGKIIGQKRITQEDEKRIEDLKRQASEIRRQLLELQQQFDARYGVLAGKPATIEEIQKAIPEGTTLVGWVDTNYRHGACVLKKNDDPVWVPLPGKGEKGTWTKDEEGLATRLRQALDPDTAQGDWRPLAEALARQRIAPIREHLRGVKRLVIVNSPGMAGVPVEALLAAQERTEGANMAVSYAPSASMFAYLVDKKTTADRPPTLLALGDPAYPAPKPEPPAPTPPNQGIFISRVVPNGNADLNGFRAGDVLIEYAGKPLKTFDDLKTVADDAGPRKVPARYWRAGEMRSVELAAGPLGVALDKRPPTQVVLASRAAEKVLVGMRSGTWERLPGTRREVEAIAALFPAHGVRTILGEEARETTVQGLAGAGKLRGYRFLHFASHGTTDPRNAYRSALILAPDPDRSTDPLAALDTDGTITAEQIARTWDLDADLVVLSACQSGLGPLTGGEGYLGFSQALFSKGAHSLVLSLWKVDDDATALLMTRFYGNLIGTRPGLKSPLPKAEALAEAKGWLRTAKAEEVGQALAALPRGTIVRREAVAPKPTTCPYENPTYWAGFILIGAPD
jgi:tetratricopeptide (TPR) repeat protein